MWNNLTKEEDIFKKYHERLTRELHFAYCHLIILEALDKARSQYHEELMQAPSFFTYTEHSHLTEVIMRINRICDNNDTSLNIFKLLDYAERNISIFSDDNFKRRKAPFGITLDTKHSQNPIINKNYIIQQRKQYLSFKNDNLKILRNKALAHIEEKDVINNVFQYGEYSVTYEHLEDIMNQLNNTLSGLGYAFDGLVTDITFTYLTEEIERFMEVIKNGLENR